MNQEQLLGFAREAAHPFKLQEELETAWFRENFLPRFAALVAANERDACAKVCETDELCCKCGDECAAAIRNRGEAK